MKCQHSKLCYKQCEKGKVFLCLQCKWKEAITSLTNLVKEPSTYRILFNWKKKLFRIKSCISLAELCWVEILKYKLWNMDISTKCWDSKEAIGLKLRRRGLAAAAVRAKILSFKSKFPVVNYFINQLNILERGKGKF